MRVLLSWSFGSTRVEQNKYEMSIQERILSNLKEIGIDLEEYFGQKIATDGIEWIVKWYKENFTQENKAEASRADALKAIADWFYFGKYGIRDYVVARELYRLSSIEGNEMAMGAYAEMLDDAEGGKRDAQLAVKLYEKLAENIPYFQRRMATCFEVGRGVEVNIKKVFELLEECSESNGCAAFDLARSKYFEDFETLDFKKIRNLYQKAGQKGCSCAIRQLRILDFHNLGIISRVPFDDNKFNEANNDCHSLLTAAFCFAFGIDCEVNLVNAIEAIQAFDKRGMKKCQHRFAAERLKEFLLDDAKSYNYILGVTNKINIVNHEYLEEIQARFESEKVLDSIAIAAFWIAFAKVCKSNGWLPLSYEARRKAALAETKAVGYTPEEVSNAQADVGYIFNKISATGTLIPFEIDESSIPNDDSSVADLRGIYFKTKRNEVISDISIVGSMDSKHIPLLTNEDLLVALALSFGEEKIVSPSLSIEDVKNSPIKRLCLHLQQKLFKPEWLSTTNFGKSLYYADWLMCQGFNGTISIKAPFSWVDHNISRLNGSIFDSIVFDHPGEGADSSRVMLFFKSLDYSSEVKKNWFSKETIWWVNKIDFMIEGSGISYLENGKEDRSIGLNDPHHPGAHSGIILTQRFDLLCEAYPVFARVKELFALAKLAQNLRNKGFVLSPKLQSVVDKSLQKWKQQIPKKPEIILNW